MQVLLAVDAMAILRVTVDVVDRLARVKGRSLGIGLPRCLFMMVFTDFSYFRFENFLLDRDQSVSRIILTGI